MNKYDHKTIESKWRQAWEEENLYKMPELKKGEEKFYSLYSFPYPSGAGLHVGHVEGMVANDISARYNRMKGKKVVLPMGWDSFGLPAENYAIKTGIHPQESTDEIVKTFKEQIKEVGISVDWDTEVAAHDPNYYKWTQWIFLQLYKAGLAYKKKAPVNWCPKDQTVLANEQVVDGKCERCDTEVVQKDMEQWFYKITDFAERLHKDLDKVDWPKGTKIQQRNWIGRSEGAILKFEVKGQGSEKNHLEVFSTAYDTIFGATFMVVAPEHKFLIENKEKINNWEEVNEYIEKTKSKTELERQRNKEKTGVKIDGFVAINPANQKEIPIFVSDYVLAGYGTGAIMAVPGHDDRDNDFATNFGIEVIYLTGKDELLSYSGEIVDNLSKYTMKNSGKYDGMNFKDAKEQMLNDFEKDGFAKQKVSYKLRDWLLSRQRYWGCPIPIVYDPEGNAHPVDEKDLPVVLPHDVDFKPTGESPLKDSKEFHASAEEKYGKGWRREVDTMDTFVDSSWYFFRHIDAKNDKEFVDPVKANAWLPTDLYMIGAEHIVLHLLYSRFFTKFFFDKDLIDFDEPFYKMRHMGLIQGSDGRKMSKRWGNVINPVDEIEKYGADALRIYEMFMGPLFDAKPWNDRAESGVFRFLFKVWNQHEKVEKGIDSVEQKRWINKLIKKVGKDIEELSFNTSVAKFMEFINFVDKEKKIDESVWKNFLKVLSPFAPFMTEELWEMLGNSSSIHKETWPEYDEKLTFDETITIAVQVNGKVRDKVEISAGEEQKSVEQKALAQENVKKYVEGEPKKVIFVKDKIINFIV